MWCVCHHHPGAQAACAPVHSILRRRICRDTAAGERGCGGAADAFAVHHRGRCVGDTHTTERATEWRHATREAELRWHELRRLP